MVLHGGYVDLPATRRIAERLSPLGLEAGPAETLFAEFLELLPSQYSRHLEEGAQLHRVQCQLESRGWAEYCPEGFWRPVRLVRTSFATSDVVLAVCDIASKLTGVRLIVCLRVSIMMLATNEEPYWLGDLYWRPCKSQHEHRDSYQIEYLSRIAHWADIIEWLYSRESSASETHHHQDKNGEGPET